MSGLAVVNTPFREYVVFFFALPTLPVVLLGIGME